MDKAAEILSVPMIFYNWPNNSFNTPLLMRGNAAWLQLMSECRVIMEIASSSFDGVGKLSASENPSPSKTVFKTSWLKITTEKDWKLHPNRLLMTLDSLLFCSWPSPCAFCNTNIFKQQQNTISIWAFFHELTLFWVGFMNNSAGFHFWLAKLWYGIHWHDPDLILDDLYLEDPYIKLKD